MKGHRVTVRLDERTRMLLNELSEMTGTTVSVIVRGIVKQRIESLLDKAGNWKIKPNEERHDNQ